MAPDHQLQLQTEQVWRHLRVTLLPVLASYIAELKPTSTEAPVGLHKAEACTG